ncbi:MAG: zinc-binding dehydrogenase, partial [Solirubrobacteraceae bacterium]
AVTLDGADDLAKRMAEAADDRIDVVVDPLFGEPFAAALNAASFGARIVQVGSGAGNESTVSSAAIRGKMLVILGHTNFAAPPEVKREAYASLSALAATGELKVESEAFELERVGEAWERLQSGSHRKIVLVPPGR